MRERRRQHYLSSRGLENRTGILTAAWLLPSTGVWQLLGLGTGKPINWEEGPGSQRDGNAGVRKNGLLTDRAAGQRVGGEVDLKKRIYRASEVTRMRALSARKGEREGDSSEQEAYDPPHLCSTEKRWVQLAEREKEKNQI